MLYLGKRIYASFIDLLALLYPFYVYFIGSDPGSFIPRLFLIYSTLLFTAGFSPSILLNAGLM